MDQTLYCLNCGEPYKSDPNSPSVLGVDWCGLHGIPTAEATRYGGVGYQRGPLTEDQKRRVCYWRTGMRNANVQPSPRELRERAEHAARVTIIHPPRR